MLVMCEKWAGDSYILTQSSSDHSSTSFSSWLGCSTVGYWGPKALCLPLVLTLASCPQLTPTATGTGTDPSRLCHLVISLFDIHLLPLIYTGASLDWRFSRGSICNIRVGPTIYTRTEEWVLIEFFKIFYKKAKPSLNTQVEKNNLKSK